MPVDRAKVIRDMLARMFPTRADSVQQGLLPRATEPRGPSEKEQGLRGLVGSGLITPETADSARADLLKFRPEPPETQALKVEPPSEKKTSLQNLVQQGLMPQATADSLIGGAKKIPTPATPKDKDTEARRDKLRAQLVRWMSFANDPDNKKDRTLIDEAKRQIAEIRAELDAMKGVNPEYTGEGPARSSAGALTPDRIRNMTPEEVERLTPAQAAEYLRILGVQ